MIEQAMLSGMATLLLTGRNQPADPLQIHPLIQIWPLQNGSPQSNRGHHGRFTLDSFSAQPTNNEVPVNKLVYGLSDHLSPQNSCSAELLYSDVKMFPSAL